MGFSADLICTDRIRQNKNSIPSAMEEKNGNEIEFTAVSAGVRLIFITFIRLFSHRLKKNSRAIKRREKRVYHRMRCAEGVNNI